MNKNQMIGRSVALCAAIFFGVNTTFSRLAYDTGTTPISLTFYRFLMSSLVMAALILLLRKSWKISPTPLVFTLSVLGMFATSVGHLGAVKFIPVSLSAIIFYTFPLQVVAYKRLVNRQAITRFEMFAFVLAFIGIGIALGPEFHQMNPVGLAMAYLGSLGATVFIIAYEHFPDDSDSYVGTFWIMLCSFVLAIVALQTGFELVPPGEPVGWVYLVLITVCSLTAFVLTLQAIQRVGGAILALFLNFEPVIILMLAWLVIGETLTPGRVSGIVLVIAALFISNINGATITNNSEARANSEV